MSFISDSWRTISIGDFVSLQRGHDLTNEERKEGKVPVYGAAGQNGYHNKAIAKGPGIVIGRSGGSFGKVHISKEDFWPHNTALYVTDFKGNDPYFTYYLLKLLNFSALNSGSAQPSLNRNFLYPLKIKVPNQNEQKKIGALLFALDNKIELNNRINAELEAMAKTIYDYWFVQFDFPVSPSGEMSAKGGQRGYKTSGGKMVWNESLKREIPEGWEVGSLLDIAEFTNGLACQKFRPINKTDFLPVIKIREMNEGISENTELVRSDIPDKVIINNGDVLFSWSASLEVKIWTRGKAGLNQHIFKVTSEKYPRTYYYFEVLAYLQHFKMIASLRKTTMGHITQDHLKQSRISIPPKSIIELLHKKINPFIELSIKNQEQNQQLTELRDWLLPMLMNGQVKVKEAEEMLPTAIGMVAEGETIYNTKKKSSDGNVR